MHHSFFGQIDEPLGEPLEVFDRHPFATGRLLASERVAQVLTSREAESARLPIDRSDNDFRHISNQPIGDASLPGCDIYR